jgi:uncharacterized damage-inducible protein DinB
MLSTGNSILAYQIKFWRETVKPTIDEALKRTPQNKLDWAPAEGMITLGQAFLHIAECSDWWYDEVMKGQSAVELAKGKCPSKKIITRHLSDHWKRLDRFFAEKPAVLSQKYKVPGAPTTFRPTGIWIFTHLMEHDLHHRSQINQYLRILKITPPEI